jgi:magnesium transporter
MIETRIQFKDFFWLDLCNPTREVLDKLAEDYKLHPTSVQDCLEPEHLPKFERFDDMTFVILRGVDAESLSDPDSDTVQELTRKLAIFYGPGYLITVHRTEQPYLNAILARWKARTGIACTIQLVFIDIFHEVIKTFDRPVASCVAQLETIEEEIFGSGTRRKFKIREGYYLKRKISVFKRILRASIEPLLQSQGDADKKTRPHFQNVRERMEGIFFNAEEISESASSLLNLHISLASQRTNEASRRTNEVMRVLTIFSCFFLPINFIASIYGMNFDFMPETKWEYGYYSALGLMVLVVLSIFIWFRRRGWLKGTAP